MYLKLKLTAMLQFFTRPTITGKHAGKIIVLDYMKLEGARLENCVLLYMGGSLTMINTVTNNCRYQMSGAAGNALAVMKALDGNGDLIELTFPKTIANAICEDRKTRTQN